MALVQFGQVFAGVALVGLVALAIAHVLIAVLAVVSVITSRQSLGMKAVWFLLIWAMPLIGSVLWFLVGRREERAQWNPAASLPHVPRGAGSL
ncbi:PLD nuclease N-terminal domain-containing protein [Kutzneria buriramensis]|nr:PLD nuclease N-terminal domain-containing protein [Kutzneria buriramensis]